MTNGYAALTSNTSISNLYRRTRQVTLTDNALLINQPHASNHIQA